MEFKDALYFFAGIQEEDFALAKDFITVSAFPKNKAGADGLFNVVKKFPKQLAFVNKGFVRVFYIHPKTDKQINVYFYKEGEMLYSYLDDDLKHLENYYIEILEDTTFTVITKEDLEYLYKTSPQWEHFGRLLAEYYYRGNYNRMASFVFKSPEERYLELMDTFPSVFQRTSLLNIASYLGIEQQSLSRIRKRLITKKR